MKTSFVCTLAAVAGLGLTACETYGPGQSSGTLIGAGSGAALGAIAGNNVRGISKTEGAVAGALAGGVIGNVMGRQQDQINEIRRDQYYRDGYYYDRYGRRVPPPRNSRYYY